MPRPLLLLLGDSITEFGSDWQSGGYVARLLQRFARSADLAQRGMGGYNTQWFMDVVIETLTTDLSTTLHPQLITLWLGANDAALPDGPSASQHVPLDRYKANLQAMVALFKDKAPQAHVLLITPPPVDEDARRIRNVDGRLDRSNAAAREYADACVAVGREAGVDVLDVHSRFMASGPGEAWKSLLVDGLHLSTQGNELVEQLITDTVAATFPALYSQLLQLEFPLWVPPPPPTTTTESIDVTAMVTETNPAMAVRDSAVRGSVRGDADDAVSGLLVPVVVVCVALLAVVGRRVQRNRGARKAPQPRGQESDRLLVSATAEEMPTMEGTTGPGFEPSAAAERNVHPAHP